MRALSLRNGQTRRASSAAGADVQLAGGSTSSNACRSRHRRAATSKLDSPTSRSRVNGGVDNRVERGAPRRAKKPAPPPAAALVLWSGGGAPPSPPRVGRGG